MKIPIVDDSVKIRNSIRSIAANPSDSVFEYENGNFVNGAYIKKRTMCRH